MSGSRNIFAKVGAAPELASKDQESESDNEEQELEGDKTRVMNMKQEGPFLVPQMGWMKDNLNLDNLTSDFLESNVTGEVMNLDDFLKELQVNELTGGADMAPPVTAPPPQMSRDARGNCLNAPTSVRMMMRVRRGAWATSPPQSASTSARMT